jgi:hypothetical protein
MLELLKRGWLDFGARYLPGSTSGKDVHNPDMAGVFVVGYSVLDEVKQLRSVGRCVTLQNHGGTDFFAERVARHANQHRLGDVGMLA